MFHILYLVHDLSDPAVRRRVIMLKAGGSEVTLAGFRRGHQPVTDVAGLSPIDLGKTTDGRFAQRLAAVAEAALSLRAKLGKMRRPDIIIGRNLEMLALANRARAAFGADTPIVYESLDIHRLLLRQDSIGRAMRAAERRLARHCAILVTSSPAFVREYFEPYGQISAPVLLLQNKVLELPGRPEEVSHGAAAPAAGAPWKVGWFGALRCRRSLELLAAFSRRMEGRFEVVLRGRPAYSEFVDFDAFVAAEPYLRFQGPYRNPEDLASIYGSVHFSWTIDFFEAGLNSEWLLPNRLYESCRHGVVPIAVKTTETGRFLADRHIGLLLDDASDDVLTAKVGGIETGDYEAKRRDILLQDPRTFVHDAGDCRAFVDRLKALAAARQPAAPIRAAA